MKGFKRVKGVIVLEVFDVFLLFYFFSLGLVVLYTVFMVFPLPQTLVKTLAKNQVKNPGQKSGLLKAFKGFQKVVF